MTVPCHTSLLCPRIYRDQYWHDNQPLWIYGDPAYRSWFHLQVPFSRQNLTPNPVNYNKAMSQTQVSVEWLFNGIETSQQTFVLMKTSSRRLNQDEYVRLSLTSSEDVFKTSWSRPIYSSWLYVFKTSCKNVFKTSSRRLQDVSSS